MAGMLKKRLIPVSLLLVILFIVYMGSVGVATESSTPELSLFSPAEGTILNTSNPTVSFSVYDPDLISETGFYIKVNGTPVNARIIFSGHWETDACTGQKYWVVDSYDQATITGTASALQDGTQTVEIMAADRLGNQAVKTWSINVAAPPTFSGMTPANGTTVNNNTSVAVRVTDNSEVDPASIAMTVDGLPVAATFDASNGLVSYTAQPALLDGPHVIGITARDASGTQAYDTWSYTIQAAGPALTFADAGKTFTTASPAISVWAKSNLKLDSSAASMTIDGQTVSADFTYKGHWESDFEIDPWYVVDSYNEGEIKGLPPSLRDGSHTAAVTAKDILGNTTTSQWDFMVNAKPAYSEAIPANGSQTTDNSGFSVKLTDNDAVIPTSVAVYLDGGLVPAQFDSTTGSLTYKPVGGIPDGSHTVAISAVDTTGNESSFSWSFVVQTAGAELTFADAGVTFDTCNPTLTVNLKSNVRIVDTSAAMTIDGQPVMAGFVYKGHLYQDPYEDFSYWIVDSYNEGTLTFNASALGDGTHEIAVTAADVLGNTGSKSWNFTIAQKPVFSGIEPVNGSTVNVKTPVIKAVISDPNGPAVDLSTVSLFIDNQKVQPALTETNGEVALSYISTVLADDMYHNVSLTASDTAIPANTNTVSWKFYINSQGDMTVDAQSCGSCHTLNQYDKYQHSEGPLGVSVQDPYPTHFYSNKCSHCHNGYKDQTCGYCHDGDPMPQYDDNGDWIPSPPETPSLAAGQNCLYCHSTYNGGWVPSAYPANHYYLVKNMINTGLDPITPLYPDLTYTVRHDILPLHQVDQGSCNSCHSIYLTREHNRVNSEGVQQKCATCHENTGKQVKRSIAADNLNCTGCHNQGHNINFVDSVPADVPLYEGFEWSTLLEASIYTGDATAPAGYETGQVVISNRRADISSDSVWSFYNQQLTSEGWSVKSGAPSTGDTYFSAEFTKNNRYLTVQCYSTSIGPGAGELVGAGLRTAVWFR